MYERNAIVLERYFNKIFHFNEESNLKDNYYNYRKLFECYETLCDAKEKERVSGEDFKAISDEIKKIQTKQEKLYNNGVKYEYSRSIIFKDIKEATDKIENHLNKVEEDTQKNNDELRELGKKFVESVIDYNDKNAILQEAIAQREKAQSEYDEIYAKTKKCYDDISEDILNEARDFLNSENKEIKKELQDTFDENGKNEKNQFDADVISNTINKSIDIYKIEIETYLFGVDRVTKLFEEIETDSVKTDKHSKYYRDSEAKLKFLSSEKEYIVQFLDNERIGAIYDKKAHRKLMLESCKKFAIDFEQINKLYDIILKEIAGRSTKKIYKENYNKEYLFDLESASVEPSLDTGKMRQDAIAFVNLNYWRASGMRNVYDTFDEIATNIYGKDLTEFIPEVVEPEPEPEQVVEQVAEQVPQQAEVAQEKPKEENVEIITEAQEKAKDTVQETAQEEVQNVVQVETQEKVQNVAQIAAEDGDPESIDELQKEILKVLNEQIDEVQEINKLEDTDAKGVVEQVENVEDVQDVQEAQEVQEEKKAPNRVYYSSKKQLAKAIFYSLQHYDLAGVKDIELPQAQEVAQDTSDEEYSVPENVEAILKNIEEEDKKKAAELAKIEELKQIEEIKNIENDESFVYSEDDDIEYEADDITAEEVESLNAKAEYEEDDDEDSIIEMYMNENKENVIPEAPELKSKVKKFTRKVGLLQRLARLNAKKEDEEM